MGLNYSFAKTANTAVVIERQGSGRTNLTDVMKVSIDKIERLHKAHPDWSASRLSNAASATQNLVMHVADMHGWQLKSSKTNHIPNFSKA